MQLLLENGFQNVQELDGGYSAWIKLGYPVQSNSPVPATITATTTPAEYIWDIRPLKAGELAVDFRLRDVNSIEYSLYDLACEKPVVLQFGSYSTPSFRQQIAATEDLIAKYGDQIYFFTLYVVESHPVGSDSPYTGKESLDSYSYDTLDNPVCQPKTYEERVALASLLIEDSNTTSIVLMDEIDNPIWKIYGRAPNIAYLIDTDCKIFKAQRWYNAESMEAAIQHILDTTQN